jgi:signal peptidase
MTQLLTSPRTKRAANVLGIVLLIAVVAPFLVYAVPEVVGADESFVVLTPSMTPAIMPGDVVIVAERDPATVTDGDVITFMRGTSEVPVTHRVTDVVQTSDGVAFETMGDANEGPDPGLVPGANLVGVVALTIPYIGYVIQFAGTQAGFVALVLLPFGLLAVTELWSLVKSRNETEPDETTAGAAAAAVDEATGDDADAEAPAPAPAADDAATEPASGGISVDSVGGAAAMLAMFAPYAIYVALELRTAPAVAVAIATSLLLLGALAMWIPASGVLDRSEPTDVPPAADAATAETDGGVQSSATTDDGETALDEPDSTDDGADPFESTDALATADEEATTPASAERTEGGN